MNETDAIREQLAVERAHLREIADAICRGVAPESRAVALYTDWATQRLLAQVSAYQLALKALPVTAHGAAEPDGDGLVAAAAAASGAQSAPERAQHLLALLDRWTHALEVLAGRTVRVTPWRLAANLSADTILQERALFTAARAAAQPA